jgi:hypothetical protein
MSYIACLLSLAMAISHRQKQKGKKKNLEEKKIKKNVSNFLRRRRRVLGRQRFVGANL